MHASTRRVLIGLVVVASVAIAAPSSAMSATNISLQITLARTRVPAGTPIHAVVTLINGGSYAIKTRACALDGLLGVELESRTYHPAVAVATVGCAKKFRLSNGATRLTETIPTTYLSCSPSTHPCVDGKPPSLPAGLYRAISINIGLPKNVIMVTSRPVTLIR